MRLPANVVLAQAESYPSRYVFCANSTNVPNGLFPVIREKKRLKPQPSIAQALDFRR